MVRSLVLVLVLVPSLAAPSWAAYFLKVGDIEGDVIAEGYTGWIEVDDFGIRVERTFTPSPGKDRESSAPAFSDFQTVGRISSASVHLFGDFFEGEGQNVELQFVTEGADRPRPIAAWKLENALLSSYEQRGTGGGVPSEHLSFNFTKIAYTYYEYGKGGAGLPIGEVTYQWDLATGRTTSSLTGEVSSFQFFTGGLVPEPASLALLGVGGLALLRRR